MEEMTKKLLELADSMPGYSSEQLIKDVMTKLASRKLPLTCKLSDAARILSCSPQTMRKLIRDGEIRPVSGGGARGHNLIIALDEIQRYVDRRKGQEDE